MKGIRPLEDSCTKLELVRVCCADVEFYGCEELLDCRLELRSSFFNIQ